MANNGNASDMHLNMDRAAKAVKSLIDAGDRVRQASKQVMGVRVNGCAPHPGLDRDSSVLPVVTDQHEEVQRAIAAGKTQYEAAQATKKHKKRKYRHKRRWYNILRIF